MANNKPEGAFAEANIRNFPGISGERLLDGTVAAAEMVNFRIRSDGSLETRCGYRRIFTAPGVPRTVFSGYHAGESVLYFLIGSGIYRYYEGDEYGYLYCGSVGTTEGNAEFAVYHGKLYLFDGAEIYVKDGTHFRRAEGYLPLYGKDWGPSTCGDVYEEENLLTPRVRIRYRNEAGETKICFPRRVESVDRILIDGIEIPTEAATLLGTGLECTCVDFEAAEEIEVIVTLHTEDRRATIRSLTRVLPYGEADERSLLCYGGSDAARLYSSTAVSESSARESDSRGGCCGGELYFPVTGISYCLDAPITAVCRHYGRLLLFTGSGAWVMDPAGDSVVQVHASIGCDKTDGAVLCGNTPMTYFGGRLWAWSVKRESENEYSASVLSDPVSKTVMEMRSGRVLMQYYPARGELWISSGKGEILIYNTERAVFYRFSGIAADRLIASAEDVLFLSGTSLMQMDEALSEDEDGVGIRAYYESGWLDFGHPERTKRAVRYLLSGNPGGGNLTLRIQSERGVTATASLFGRAATVPNAYGGRISVGRFRYLSYSITVRGAARASVHALTVTARK